MVHEQELCYCQDPSAPSRLSATFFSSQMLHTSWDSIRRRNRIAGALTIFNVSLNANDLICRNSTSGPG
jgi:hypothetical protein